MNRGGIWGIDQGRGRSLSKKKTDPRLVYSEKVANEIFDRMAAGESLTNICLAEHMPNRKTVLRWQDAERGAPVDFGPRYAQAVQDRADRCFDEIIDLADGAAVSAEVEAAIAGRNVSSNVRHKVERRAYNEEIQARKLRIEARKWALSRMNRSKYGDRSELAVSGTDDQPPVEVNLKTVHDVKHMKETLRILDEVLNGKNK